MPYDLSLYSGERQTVSPYENLFPHSCIENHFHYRLCTVDEAAALATDLGMEILDPAGQSTYQIQENGRRGSILTDNEMALRPKVAGQFRIFAARKSASDTC